MGIAFSTLSISVSHMCDGLANGMRRRKWAERIPANKGFIFLMKPVRSSSSPAQASTSQHKPAT